MYSLLIPPTESFNGSACVIATSVGPYRVIEKIGAGGMGEVYLAEDTRLGRKVALKTISSRASQDARERLLHEARAAATLNHNNLAAIYDVIEEGSEIYIVMEFVDGSTLANRLRFGAMVPDEALTIGAQILEALDHAHAHGVVHRDLKPANVSLAAGGKVKILDFGIARLHPETVSARDVSTTEVGRVFGTPGYAAPEQLLGRVADHRSDLYGLGVLLFELMAGRPPFDENDLRGGTVSLMRDPPRLSDVAPQVGEGISSVVARAMAPDPERRFQSASEMLAALRALTPEVSDRPTFDGVPAPGVPAPSPAPRRWVRGAVVAAVAVTLMVLAGLPLARYWRTAPRAGEPAARMTVAVLPLANRSGDPAYDTVGPGMSEAIGTMLIGQPEIVVISRSEISQAAALHQNVLEIARELGVQYLVQGGLQKAQDTLQLNLQLVRPDGRGVWGETFAGSVNDMLDLQARAAIGIAKALATGAEKIRQSSQAVDAEALADYWQGRQMLDRRDVPGNLTRAIEAFERVTRRASSYAPVHAALGEAYWEQYIATLEPAWTRRAIDEATTAVNLDRNDAHARYSLAVIYRGSGQLDRAEAELRRATDLQPNYADAPRLLGSVLADRNRIDDAMKAFTRAIDLRPDYAGTYRDLGTMLLRAGRYAEAEPALKKAIALAPETAHAYQQLGTLYHTMGRVDEAIPLYREAIKRGSPEAYANLGAAYYQQRHFAEAADAYEHAMQMSDTSPIRNRSLGDVYRQLGREPEARAQYERAVEKTQVMLTVNPHDATNLSRLAVYEAKLGRFADATRHLDEAVKVLPNDGGVLFRHACVLAMQRRYDPAMQALRGAVTAGYSVSTIRDEEDLAPLRARDDFKALVASKQ